MAGLPPIRGILFDKDGTLLDYAASWTPINRAAALLAARGDEALAARLLVLGGADARGGSVSADSLLAAGNTIEIAGTWIAAGAPFAPAELVAAIDRLFRDAADTVVPAADLPVVLGRLRARGFRLGIASSDNEDAIRATARRFAIDGLLDYVAGYDSGHGVKPEPGMVLGFCEAAGLAPAAVAMVGDNLHDLAMGRAAGCGLVVGVLTGTGTVGTLTPAADLVLPSIAELDDALAGRGP